MTWARVDRGELRRRFPGDEYLRWQVDPADTGSAIGSTGAAWATWTPAPPAPPDPAAPTAAPPPTGAPPVPPPLTGAPPAPSAGVLPGPRLVVAGEPAAAAELFTALAAELRPDRVSVAAAAVAVLPAALRPVGGDGWDWFVTAAAPPAPAGPVGLVPTPLLPATPSTRAELAGFLAAHSPRASADPEREDDARWWAVRGAGGELLATVAVETLGSGAVHLRALAVAGAARGRGLGAVLTAAVVRDALAAGAPVVTLGMYADNAPARRLYRRLGFRDTHHWRSGRLPPPAAPAGVPARV